MSPNAKPAGDFREQSQESWSLRIPQLTQPEESLKDKECYTQLTLGQGGLIFITVTKGDATVWCPRVSISGTWYLHEPSEKPREAVN